jgi:catechol 2,3-dioxygenase-like lactoylglutathione lyase family enzyme
MIKKLSHVTIYVLNQNEALKFYTEKLGFEVRTDNTLEGFRWLTVGPKTQPDIEMVLFEPQPGFMFDEKTVAQMRELVGKGALGGGVFNTSDCKATYEELKSRGVEFFSPPQERPYGVEAVFKDNSGNWFSLTQHKED